MKEKINNMISIVVGLFDKRTMIAVLAVFLISFSCSKDKTVVDQNDDDASVDDDSNSQSEDPVTYNADWTDSSHGKSDANYATVFPQEKVNTIEITMTASQWESIRSNMTSLYGSDFGGSGGQGGGGGFPDENPDYVDVTLSFNGKIWKNVGYRLKGNSSLSSIWGEGNYKLPFKLDMDEFEEDYPAVNNQRFYGFKKISFSPSFRDQSLMREKITPEIFRMAGIPAAQTAFYAVYIDFGEGSKYCGLYTAVETIDDTMVETQFGEDDGNIYKPESYFSAFSETDLEKKNNESEADFSDVKAFITALNSASRTTDAVLWRTDLEKTFDVEHFLKYLAINNGIVNWDSYGNMAHNHYLYSHSSNALTWIPWDHNEALSGSPGITGTDNGSPGGGMDHSPLSLSMNEVSSSWPLLYNIANDTEYMTQYQEYLKQFNDTVFIQTTMDEMIDAYYRLISPYVIGDNGENSGYSHLDSDASFTSAYSALKSHIANRKEVISSYVD